MTEEFPKDVMDALKMVEVAGEILQKYAAKGMTVENSAAMRIINDLTYWLQDSAMKLALAEKMIRVFYGEDPGALPPTYETWRKIRDGEEYKPKIHLVKP